MIYYWILRANERKQICMFLYKVSVIEWTSKSTNHYEVLSLAQIQQTLKFQHPQNLTNDTVPKHHGTTNMLQISEYPSLGL